MPGKVVVLDNEAHSISLLGHILSHLDVAGFSTVEDYLACTEKDSDCIVLDGSGMNSSDDELFRMLREHPDTSGIPVIYVGDNLSIDTRLAIYEAGVDDYVSKPFDVADLQAKVSRALHQRRYERELLDNAENAKQAAFEAMTHSAEQGEIVRFMEQISMCQKLDELAQALLNLLSRFGLNAVFSCWLEGDEWPHYYSHSGVASPLEQGLMQSGHGGGRIMEFGRRMLVNYPRTALLIKNVPYEEEARFGRIKDHLAVVLSAADARVSSLNMEERLRQKDRLLDVVSDVKQALLDVQKRQDEMKVRAANERDDVKLELREELLTLGLHEEQEERMLSLVMDFLKSLEGLYNEAMDWQKDLEPVMDAVEYVVSGGESSA
jgi:DNA-binding response OmpR family regulator